MGRRLVRRIDEMIAEKSLLKHPFYEMWSAGELTLDSLSGYSKEYFQLVKAVPGFMDPIIELAPGPVSAELADNRAEESAHIGPWRGFAASLGVSEPELEGYEGLEKTGRAVDSLNSLMTTYEGGACAMYAFEKEIPEISRAKLDGLEEFYGLTSPQATEYFRLHTEADVRHAASWRGILESSVTPEDDLMAAAKGSITAQNTLLDGCYEAYCSRRPRRPRRRTRSS